MAGPWSYDKTSRRYRNTETGRYLSNKQMLGLRDTFSAKQAEKVKDLAGKVSNGLTVGEWERSMRATIRNNTVDQYVLGRGGRNAMTPADWGRVGQLVRGQYKYAAQFAQDIADAKLSAAQIAARSQLYMAASTNAYERGGAASFKGLRLPTYPADGSQECKANCKCSWDIADKADRYEATWTLGVADHCSTCISNAGQYAPFVQVK